MHVKMTSDQVWEPYDDNHNVSQISVNVLHREYKSEDNQGSSSSDDIEFVSMNISAISIAENGESFGEEDSTENGCCELSRGCVIGMACEECLNGKRDINAMQSHSPSKVVNVELFS